MIDRATQGPRPARYTPSGVVVLAQIDAYEIMQLLDPEKVRRARNGTRESVIGSLQALARAAADHASFAGESKPAAPAKLTQHLDTTVSTTWVADRLELTTQGVVAACKNNLIPGAHQVEGHWRIPLAGYEHYRQNRRSK